MNFSVVIPLYNKGPYIKRAINSVLNQTIQDFEIIVVNDGSTDNGQEIVEGIRDPRIRLINQPNQGVSIARNRGIEESRYPYIAFLDADDEWKPCFLEEIFSLYKDYPNCGAYSTAYDIIEKNNKIIKPKNRRLSKKYRGKINRIFKVLKDGLPFYTSSIMIPKKILLEIDGFPPGVQRGEDQIVWIKIAAKYPIAFSSSRQAIYHRDAVGRVCNTIAIKTGFTDKQLCVKTILDAHQLNSLSQKDLVEYYQKSLTTSAFDAMKNNNIADVNLFLSEGAKYGLINKELLALKLISKIPDSMKSILLKMIGLVE